MGKLPETLAKQIIENNSTLIEVDLRHQSLDDEDVMALANGLAKNTRVKVLELAGNAISALGMARLSAMFLQNDSLVALNLSETGLKDEGATQWETILSANRRLTGLSLGKNGMSDKGIASLCRGLIKNQRLFALDLSNNALSAQGVAHLNHALQDNRTLTELDLQANPMTTASAQVLETLVNHNQALIYVNLTNTGIEEETKKRIEKKIQQNVNKARQLFQAVSEKRTEEAIALFDEGVSPYVYDSDCGFEPKKGNSLLHVIAAAGDVKLLQHVIAKVPELNGFIENEREESLLEVARKNQQTPMVCYLMDLFSAKRPQQGSIPVAQLTSLWRSKAAMKPEGKKKTPGCPGNTRKRKQGEALNKNNTALTVIEQNMVFPQRDSRKRMKKRGSHAPQPSGTPPKI